MIKSKHGGTDRQRYSSSILEDSINESVASSTSNSRTSETLRRNMGNGNNRNQIPNRRTESKRNLMNTPEGDFGQRKRSQFEMHEVGQCSLWLDEVQYQLDTLGKSTTSDELKSSSLLRLLQMLCEERPTPTGSCGETREYQELLQHITLLLDAKPLSLATGLALLLVLLAASRDCDGRFRQRLIYPEALQLALLRVYANSSNIITSSDEISSGAVVNKSIVPAKGSEIHHQRCTVKSPPQCHTAVPAFRRKRKFTTTAVADAKASPVSSFVCGVDTSQAGPAAVNLIRTVLSEKFPVLMSSLFPQVDTANAADSVRGIPAPVIFDALCLLLINRYVHNSVSLLAAVQTDMFAAKPTPTGASYDVQQEGSAIQIDGSMELESAASLKLKDSTAEDMDAEEEEQDDADVAHAAGKSGFLVDTQANVLSLRRFQQQMRAKVNNFPGDQAQQDSISNSSRQLDKNTYDATFLHVIAKNFKNAMESTLNNHSTKTSNSSMTAQDSSRYNLWLLLGVIDGACFRCPANQVPSFSSTFHSLVLLSHE